jgi:hypothetical protein
LRCPKRIEMANLLTNTDGIRPWMKAFIRAARAAQLVSFVLERRVLTDDERDELRNARAGYDPVTWLTAEMVRLADKFVVHIEDAEHPHDVYTILMGIAPNEKDPTAVVRWKQKMEANTLRSNNWDVSDMYENLLSFNKQHTSAGGHELTDEEFKRMLIKNVSMPKLTVQLLATGTSAEILKLLRAAQSFGEIPFPATTTVGEQNPFPTAFVTEQGTPDETISSTQGNHSAAADDGSSNGAHQANSSYRGAHPQREERLPVHCDRCNTMHLKGVHYCPLICGHCNKDGHSSSACTKRIRDKAFKQKQKRKIKNALYADYVGHGPGHSPRHLASAFQRMDLHEYKQDEDRERARQVLVNHHYASQMAQRASLTRRDRRGSFGEESSVGHRENLKSAVKPADRGGQYGPNLGGVFSTKFPAHGENFGNYMDFHRGL